MVDVIQRAAASPNHRAFSGQETLVVGSYSANEIDVYVSAYQTNLLRSTRTEMVLHTSFLAILGIAAAAIVNVVIWKLVAHPLARLEDSVLRIADGELSVRTGRFRSRELHLLGDATESVRRSLAKNEQDRRIQMDKETEIQTSLLPNGQDIPGLSVERLFLPAQDLAGNFYDFLELSDAAWLLTISDVTGHGVPAARCWIRQNDLVCCHRVC